MYIVVRFLNWVQAKESSRFILLKLYANFNPPVINV